MKEDKKGVSGKWEASYTWLLIANALYILIFYMIMQYYS